MGQVHDRYNLCKAHIDLGSYHCKLTMKSKSQMLEIQEIVMVRACWHFEELGCWDERSVFQNRLIRSTCSVVF